MQFNHDNIISTNIKARLDESKKKITAYVAWFNVYKIIFTERVVL